MHEPHDTRADDEAVAPATPLGEQPAARTEGRLQREDEVQGYIQSVDAGEAALPTPDVAQTRPARTVRNPATG